MSSYALAQLLIGITAGGSNSRHSINVLGAFSEPLAEPAPFCQACAEAWAPSVHAAGEGPPAGPAPGGAPVPGGKGGPARCGGPGRLGGRVRKGGGKKAREH